VPIELRAAEPILPFTLFRNRTFSAISLVMFMIGIGMFGVILYTPLFVQGVLGQTATGSGAVLTPLVLTLTAMGIVGGQLIARFRRVKPFLLFGTVMMSLGVLLLSTLDVGSSTTTVAFYLFVTALGLGLVMPTTTLAVQSAVEPEVLGVVTSSTQFIRSVGATVGTAIIGTLVTGGYVNQLTANAPAGTPPNLVESLRNPDVLVSEQALRELSRAASALPNGAQLVDSLLGVARSALAGSIREGFWFVLAGTVLAFFATLLMPDLRLEQRPATAMPPEGATAGGSATAATASASTAAIPEAGPVRTNGDSAPIGRRTPVERTH
jgi:MFS family permease